MCVSSTDMCVSSTPTHRACACARVCVSHHLVVVCWGSGAAGQAQEGDAGGKALGAEHQLDQARGDQGHPQDEGGALGWGGWRRTAVSGQHQLQMSARLLAAHDFNAHLPI